MRRAIILFIVCGASGFAQPNLGLPLVGLARDPYHQQLRLVYGVAGNFVSRDVVAGNVTTWSFAGNGGLVKTRGELLQLDRNGRTLRRTSVPGDNAVLDAGNPQAPALSFFPNNGELWKVLPQGNRRVPLESHNLGGTVMALGASSFHKTELALCRTNDLWLLTVDLDSGRVANETLVSGPIGEAACRPAQPDSLLLVRTSLVLATPSELIVQTTAGGQHRVPLGAARKSPPALHRIGETWIQVDLGDQPPLLVHVTLGGLKIYQLPLMGVRP